MAARKKTAAPRNDALAVLTQMFGDTEGWDERVAAAADTARIAEEIYALRERHGLSQADLAVRIESTQPAVARLESASYLGHSISMLRRIAAAVGEEVVVRFVPRDAAGKRRPRAPKAPARKASMLLVGGTAPKRAPSQRGKAAVLGRKVTA